VGGHLVEDNVYVNPLDWVSLKPSVERATSNEHFRSDANGWKWVHWPVNPRPEGSFRHACVMLERPEIKPLRVIVDAFAGRHASRSHCMVDNHYIAWSDLVRQTLTSWRRVGFQIARKPACSSKTLPAKPLLIFSSPAISPRATSLNI